MSAWQSCSCLPSAQMCIHSHMHSLTNDESARKYQEQLSNWSMIPMVRHNKCPWPSVASINSLQVLKTWTWYAWTGIDLKQPQEHQTDSIDLGRRTWPQMPSMQRGVEAGKTQNKAVATWELKELEWVLQKNWMEPALFLIWTYLIIVRFSGATNDSPILVYVILLGLSDAAGYFFVAETKLQLSRISKDPPSSTLSVGL